MKNIYDLVEEQGLPCGRMISAYKKDAPGCKCVWNANLITSKQGKFWYGDINLTKEGQKLKEAAAKAGEVIYVLREHDCRFDTENTPILLLLTKAVWNTDMDIP